MDKNSLHIRTADTIAQFKIMQKVFIDYGYTDESQFRLKYDIKLINDVTLAIIDRELRQADLYIYDKDSDSINNTKIF